MSDKGKTVRAENRRILIIDDERPILDVTL